MASRSRALDGPLFGGAAGAISFALGLAGLFVGCGARSELFPGDAPGGGGASGGAAGSPPGASSGGGGSSADGSSSSSSSSASSSSSSSSSSATSSSSSGPPCLSDDECDDGIGCTIDACEPTGCVHLPDHDACDDAVLCTLDVCDAGVGCQNQHSDAVCDDGIACTIDACDAATDACRNDACDNLCDDGVFCNGVERCDTTFGCAVGSPPCDLGLACSVDTCQEANDRCDHVQPSACAPDVRLLVTDATGALLQVSPYGAPTVTIAASNGNTHFDVAILGSRWFVINPNNRIAELTPMTNTQITSFQSPSANSLGAGPDGKLYAASTTVYRIDPDTGASTALGQLPAGYSSSGDIAFLNGRMFVSADGPCGGALVEFDTAAGTGTLLGGDGLGCVFGLAAAGGVLFVLNCDGKVGTFDPDTGEARTLSTPQISVYGADTLP
jgi:hypothetical protein